MKKNNLKQLKEMVNANVLEAIECIKYGVQAYNISANEYEVITKFVKVNGRYYFVDRDGNRYLASRYDRAELVARDILDNWRFAEETVYEYVCTLEEKKQVAVECAYDSRFLDFCDLFGFDVESVEMHFQNNGEVFIVYRLKSEQTAKTAGRYARISWRWLNTRHLFGDDSEAVTLTGWQYLGVAAVAIVCGLLFSIKF